MARSWQSRDILKNFATIWEVKWYRARYYDPSLQRFLGEDPIGFASKDTNWYRYTWNNPVNLVDHNGLYGTKDCSYYREVAKTVNGLTYIYYEYIGHGACEFFPTQPIFPQWTDCVRQCLQEFDKKNNCKDPCNMNSSTCIIGAHGYCWSKCGSNPDKDPVK